MNIFVAKLDFGTTSEDLQSAFETYGEVSSCKVITDHFSGKSKGFAFVEMPNDDEARAAIEGLNDTEMDGRTIVVKEAEPRENRQRGGGGGFGGGGRKPFNRGGNGGGGGGGYDRDRKPRNFNRDRSW